MVSQSNAKVKISDGDPRSMKSRFMEEANILDHFKIPDADYTAALGRALAESNTVIFPYNDGINYAISGSFTISTPRVTIRGKFGRPTIVLTGTSSRLFTLMAANIVIKNLAIDATASSLSENRVLQFDAGSSYCEISDISLTGAKQGISFRSGAHHNTLKDFKIDDCGLHAVWLTGADVHSNTITRGEINNSDGFGVLLSVGTFKNEVSLVRSEINEIELIGITYDSWGNRILNNHAEGCGDNGISVTGFSNVIQGNFCKGNEHAGIFLWGRLNTCNGNICANNNQKRLVDGTSEFSGINIQAGWGGLGRANAVSGNSCYDDQAMPTQTYGVAIQPFNYQDWSAGQTINSSYPYRKNGLKIYKAVFSGSSIVTGSTAPTHTSGTVSDGAVDWLFVNQVSDLLEATDNDIGTNTFYGNRLGDINDDSAGNNRISGRDFMTKEKATLRFEDVADPNSVITGQLGDLLLSPQSSLPWMKATVGGNTGWGKLGGLLEWTTAGRPLAADVALQMGKNSDTSRLEYSDGVEYFLADGTPVPDSFALDHRYGENLYLELGSPVTFSARHTFTRSGVASLRSAFPSTTITDFSTNVLRRDERGALIQTSADNIYPTPSAPSNQTISLAAGTYSVDIIGSGSLTLSGGPSGLVTDQNPVAFTLASTTSVTFTLSGTIVHVNLIPVTSGVPASGAIYATSPIKDPGTRAAETLQIDIGSFSATQLTAILIATSARYKRSEGTLLSIVRDTSNRYDLRNNSAGTSLLLTGTTAGVASSALATLGSTVANNTRFCVAIAINGADVYGSINGSTTVHATLDGDPGDPLSLRLGSQPGGAKASDGYHERLLLRTVAVTPAKLSQLSQLSIWD